MSALRWILFFSLALSLVGCGSALSQRFKIGEKEIVVLGIAPGPRHGKWNPGNPWAQEGHGTYIVLTPVAGKLTVFSASRQAPLLQVSEKQEILFIHDQGSVQLAFTEVWHVLDGNKRIIPTVYLCKSRVSQYQTAVIYSKRFFRYNPCTSQLIREAPGLDHLEPDFDRIAQLVERLDLLGEARKAIREGK